VTPSPQISDLIARLEKATGPDRELHGLIAVAAGKARMVNPKKSEFPNYTDSLDAAMTLARDSVEAMLMMHAAFVAFKSPNRAAPFDRWPCVKAMLLSALRAIEAKT
jgi:hypothetical protein